MPSRMKKSSGCAQRSTADPATTRGDIPALRITRHCAYGGVVSPLLLNVALHGMEHAAGVRYQRTGVRATVWLGFPEVVINADLCCAQHKSAYVGQDS